MTGQVEVANLNRPIVVSSMRRLISVVVVLVVKSQALYLYVAFFEVCVRISGGVRG